MKGVVIIGAGMAGASLAAEIAAEVPVLMLEAEAQPGYHSTGRSAAFWAESYGGPLIQPLTTASEPFLRTSGYLHQRGALHLADAEGRAELDRMRRDFFGRVQLDMLDGPAVRRLVPGLRREWDSGLFEGSCTDIDVAGLHAFYLKSARRNGAEIRTDARLLGAAKGPNGWSLETSAGRFEADIVVNAAGAWADEVASAAGMKPIGIQPYRRTIVQLRVDPPPRGNMPLIIDARGRFYFKPEAGGRIWLSPHDETESDPCDCVPEDYDVALAIYRLEQVVDWRIERVEHRWAGLRSFAPDRLPAYGFAAGRHDFFWCAGQGGFGIQTAPAAAKLAASLLLGRALDPTVAHVDPRPYLAERFAN